MDTNLPTQTSAPSASVFDVFLNVAQELQLGNFDDALTLIIPLFPILASHRPLIKRLFYNVHDQLCTTNAAILAMRDELRILHDTTRQLEQAPVSDFASRAQLSWRVTMQLISMPARIQQRVGMQSSDMSNNYDLQLLEQQERKLLMIADTPQLPQTGLVQKPEI